jgi:hypothetical protein
LRIGLYGVIFVLGDWVIAEPVHSVHPALWEGLAQADSSEEICRRSRAQFDKATGSYLIAFLQERYRIVPSSRAIEPVSGPIPAKGPSIDLQVILITYLLNAQDIPLADTLVAGSSLKGGECFFQGAHGFPLDPLVARYGRDVGGFLDRGLSLGGQQEHYGDVALRFAALPRVPVVMVLWAADEEFPARISVVFDASIDQHLPLDAITGLVTEICRRLSA